MQEIETFEDYKLKVIENFDRNISELYLLVENQCPEEIEIIDVIRVMEKVYIMIIQKEVLETKINNLEKENNILKELLIQKEIELYEAKAKTNEIC